MVNGTGDGRRPRATASGRPEPGPAHRNRRRPPPERGAGRRRRLLWVVVAVLGLTAVAITAADRLSGVINASGKATIAHDRAWWGAKLQSSNDPGSGNKTFTSCALTLDVNGSSLTATYAVTAADVSDANAARSDAPNDIVTNMLGPVQEGEFRYGIIGNQLWSDALGFTHTPPSTAPLDEFVLSASTAIYQQSQRITLLQPQTKSCAATTVTVKGATVPPKELTGVTATQEKDDATRLDVTPAAKESKETKAKLKDVGAMATFTLSEQNEPPSWFDGLRAAGAIDIPYVGWILFTLDVLFVYAVLLWALDRARLAFPRSHIVSSGLRMTQAMVVALGAVALLGFACAIAARLGHDKATGGWLQAGPLGLLVGSAIAVWPAACLRANAQRPDDWEQASARDRPGRWRLTSLSVLAHLTIATLYGLWLGHAGLNPLGSGSVLAGTALLTVTVPPLVRLLLGRRGPLTSLASAGLLAALLAATVCWPLLYEDAARIHGTLDVNRWGKWIFVAVAVIAAAGLSLMWGRLTWDALSPWRSRSRMVPALLTVTAVAVILGTIVIDAVRESGVFSVGTVGLAPVDLFDLFDTSGYLLDWLFLILAMTVVMWLPRVPESRPAARDIALPIALLLFCWDNVEWLYIPIAALAGIFLFRQFAMPRSLAETPPSGKSTATRIREADLGWRTAELSTGQQQSFSTSSVESLRNAALSASTVEFRLQLDRLDKAQGTLAGRRAAQLAEARRAKVDAFSHIGMAPDLTTAAAGAVFGAVLGIIPIALTLVLTHPSVGDGYPVLAFFGSTAWELFTWAGIGWFVGYFLPLIQGGSGATKAMWIFVAGEAANLTYAAIWYGRHDWTIFGYDALELVIFLLVTAVAVDDLRELSRADLSLADWPRVHNWQFVVSWSAALIAAVGTLAVGVATNAVSDLGQQVISHAPSSTQHH